MYEEVDVVKVWHCYILYFDQDLLHEKWNVIESVTNQIVYQTPLIY